MKREDSVEIVARKALDDASGDVKRATALMLKRVRASPALLRELIEPLLETACYERIAQCCRAARRDIWMAPNYSASGKGERVAALAAGNLMMFPLPGGLPLAEAMRDQVQAAADFYARQAGDMAHKARWLALIAQRLEGKRTVAKSMTESQLAELQEAARA